MAALMSYAGSNLPVGSHRLTYFSVDAAGNKNRLDTFLVVN